MMSHVLNPVYSNQTTIKTPVQTQLNARDLHSKDEVTDYILEQVSHQMIGNKLSKTENIKDCF